MIIQICVGSSCHLKGSEAIVELIQKNIQENRLESEITLAGSFCIGRCSKDGVTVQVDDEIIDGVSKENFKDFWENKVIKNLN